MEEDGMEVLLDAMVSGDTSGAIERQELRGQKVFVTSETLPKRCNSCDRSQLEKIGIVFGKEVDNLFVEVILPKGWSKVATEHSLWSKLVDEKDRERASIFYKTAFYDRDAFIYITPRFTISVEPVCGWEEDSHKESSWCCRVKDCGKVVWTSDEIPPEPQYRREDTVGREQYHGKWAIWYSKKEQLILPGHQWLDKHYPDWKDPTKYWD